MLSVEGMRERTDARRGKGVFDEVTAAAQRLRREGVLFGLSLTATRENAEVLSDPVLETFVDWHRRDSTPSSSTTCRSGARSPSSA